MFNFREDYTINNDNNNTTDDRDRDVSTKRLKRIGIGIYRQTKSFSKRKLLFRTVVAILCALALTYHSYLLFDQYWSGKTVVSIRVERIQPDVVPALTVCLPYALSMAGMARQYPAELATNYSRYVQIMTALVNGSDTNDTLRQQLNDMYRNFLRFYEQQQEILVDDLIDGTVSIPFKRLDDPVIVKRNDNPVFVEINGVTTGGDDDDNDDTEVYQDHRPIVSIVPEMSGHIRKCYTFFSHLLLEPNPVWTRLAFNSHEIRLNVRHQWPWFPPAIYDEGTALNKIYLSLHSPNAMPYDMRSENFLNLDINYYYEIMYSTVKTRLLPPDYETMCQSYDTNDDTNDYSRSQHMQSPPITRSQCRQQCYQQYIINDRRKCCQSLENGTKRMVRHVCRPPKAAADCTLWSTNIVPAYMVSGTNRTVCNHLQVNPSCEFRADVQCEHRCRKECLYYYYTMDIKDSMLKKPKPLRKSMSVVLKHLPLLDQTVEHMPELSMISFIANFGGLLGMWLGLSAFVIFDTIINIFK